MIQWGLDGGSHCGFQRQRGQFGSFVAFLSKPLRPRLRDSARGAVIRGLAGSSALTLHPLTFKQATFGDFSQDLF